MQKKRSCSHSVAFTLIELLVVISIISLLVSILLPALGSARKNAQAIACLSTQRQLFLAQRMYADNNNQFFAMARMTTSGYNTQGTRRSFWQFLTSEYIDGSHNKQNFSDLPDAYRCPSWLRAWYDLDHARLGIGMNACILRPDNNGSVTYSSWPTDVDGNLKACKWDDITHQSDKMMLGDSSIYYILPKYQSPSYIWQLNTVTTIKPWPYLTSAPTRHLDTANYMMFDGHGERLNPDDALHAILLN